MSSNRYSYTKVDLYKQCGFRYKLKYVDGNYDTGGGIALSFGSLVHATEEKIANCIKDNLPIDYVKVKNEFLLELAKIEHKFKKDYYTKDKSGRTYAEKAYGYLESGIYRLENYFKKHPSYEIVGAEIGFEYKYDDEHVFKGSIDRIFRDKETGVYIIQDIKTYNVPMDDEKLVTPLQFVVYVLAAKEMYNITEKDIICQYDLPLCSLTQNACTPGYLNRGLKQLANLFAKIKAEDYKPKPSTLCHWCDYCSTNENALEKNKYLCPYYMKWTRENKTYEKENEWHGMEHHQAILEYYQKVIKERGE